MSRCAQPRRLRSEFHDLFGPYGFTVGCGYAARTTEEGGKWSVRVTRLSDGVSWLLSNNGTMWVWAAPVALTCTELFISVVTKTGATIARVQLDSLGTAIPAD